MFGRGGVFALRNQTLAELVPFDRREFVRVGRLLAARQQRQRLRLGDSDSLRSIETADDGRRGPVTARQITNQRITNVAGTRHVADVERDRSRCDFKSLEAAANRFAQHHCAGGNRFDDDQIIKLFVANTTDVVPPHL